MDEVWPSCLTIELWGRGGGSNVGLAAGENLLPDSLTSNAIRPLWQRKPIQHDLLLPRFLAYILPLLANPAPARLVLLRPSVDGGRSDF